MVAHLLLTFTLYPHLRGADNPGQGTGACLSEEPLMTLTYRGKQYAPAKSASSIASNKIRLTYRGVVYAK